MALANQQMERKAGWWIPPVARQTLFIRTYAKVQSLRSASHMHHMAIAQGVRAREPKPLPTARNCQPAVAFPLIR
jgi:hypothetical protein